MEINDFIEEAKKIYVNTNALAMEVVEYMKERFEEEGFVNPYEFCIYRCENCEITDGLWGYQGVEGYAEDEVPKDILNNHAFVVDIHLDETDKDYPLILIEVITASEEERSKIHFRENYLRTGLIRSRYFDPFD